MSGREGWWGVRAGRGVTCKGGGWWGVRVGCSEQCRVGCCEQCRVGKEGGGVVNSAGW